MSKPSLNIADICSCCFFISPSPLWLKCEMETVLIFCGVQLKHSSKTRRVSNGAASKPKNNNITDWKHESTCLLNRNVQSIFPVAGINSRIRVVEAAVTAAWGPRKMTEGRWGPEISLKQKNTKGWWWW